MGTSTPLEYAAKMRLAQTAASNVPREAVPAAALLTKRLILAQTPERLRNVGKSGRRLGVKYTVTHGDGDSKALVFALGPFQLIERDIKPHAIPRLKGATGRSARRMYGPAFGGINMKHKALVTPYGIRRTVWHPGTKGKHPFEKGVAEAVSLIPNVHDTFWMGQARAIFSK